MNTPPIRIGISNRHVHLTAQHLETLFGKKYKLTPRNTIRQPGQYAAHETVTLIGKKNLEARIVGPLRTHTQVEILTEDQHTLGIHAPVKVSGNLEGTPGITLKGPRGTLTLNHGVIIAAKHLHMGTHELKLHNLEGVMHVDLRTSTGKTFTNIPVRTGEHHLSEFHLDKDEAHYLQLTKEETVTIIQRHVCSEKP